MRTYVEGATAGVLAAVVISLAAAAGTGLGWIVDPFPVRLTDAVLGPETAEGPGGWAVGIFLLLMGSAVAGMLFHVAGAGSLRGLSLALSGLAAGTILFLVGEAILGPALPLAARFGADPAPMLLSWAAYLAYGLVMAFGLQQLRAMPSPAEDARDLRGP